MKNSKKIIFDRHEKIINLLKQSESALVTDIARLMDCSINTIRRDLNFLEEQDKIIKKHGYVLLNPEYSPNVDQFGPRKIKEAIAKQTSSLIKKFDTIFINSSTTALQTLNFINYQNNTIITNNLNISTLTLPSTCHVVLTGGELRNTKRALTGIDALSLLRDKYADICVMGCYGISLETGHVFSSSTNESQINQMMVKHTRGVKVLLADYRKFNKESEEHFANISNFDYIITDSFLPNIYIQQIEKCGVQLIQVRL
ncbi:DeoR/GlpR transcriptional regulator [Vagococcus coleopterorum]|uniref:DeoR/GlpR transcriptional regulator n=1 Tax=Vagococcus coleopterorum TaxID=2714946 RepID=A0A6G8APG8_9ENTE|nr:DeoR/GlpR family DNA-binding transcription regulator [Vagococcus coleopterorum]QIL46825.1 DeoR/GlpR transcriptional regulator [Vagococcus coleopterorum]